MRKDKNQYYENLANDLIPADEKGNTRKVYSIVKQLSGSSNPLSEELKTNEGTTITDTKEFMEEWAKHFEQLLNRPTPEPDEPRRETHNPFSTVDAERPCYYEVELAIDKLKLNKASGNDGIPAELLKHVRIMLVKEFTISVRIVEKFPEEWKVAIITLIFKKGDLSLLTRHISHVHILQDTTGSG